MVAKLFPSNIQCQVPANFSWVLETRSCLQTHRVSDYSASPNVMSLPDQPNNLVRGREISFSSQHHDSSLQVVTIEDTQPRSAVTRNVQAQ